MGYNVAYIDTPHHEIDEQQALEADLLFVLGGPLGVHNVDLYPFLSQEIDILEKRLATGKANMGLCLGAQLMAKALGAHIYKGDNGQEVGWKPLKSECESFSDYFGEEPPSFMHWHRDTFDLPDGARLIASTEQYTNQAFVYENSIGFQCHPEVTEKQLRDWFVIFVGQLCGENPAACIHKLRADTEEHAPKLKTAGENFLRKWIDEVN